MVKINELAHLLQLAVELVHRDYRAALGFLQIESDLMNRGKGMDHACYGADGVDGVEADDCLRHVGKTDRNGIAFLDSYCAEGLFCLTDLRDKLCECGVLFLEGEGYLVGIFAGALEKGVAHRDIGIV